MKTSAKSAGRSAREDGPGLADARWIAALVLVGAVLRLVHVLTIRDTPYFAYLMLDPRMYDEWAESIAAGDWLGRRPFFQDPLYAYALAAVYRVFGHHYTPVVLLQSLCGALSAGLTYAATRTWFGRPAAAVAGVAAALYLPSIYYEGLILKTSLAAFLVGAALALLAFARVGGPRRTWFAAGIALGLACLDRSNVALFLPVVAGWALLDAPWTGSSAPPWRRRCTSSAAWLAVGCLLAGSILLIGATAVRNRVVGGEWILTTSNAGQNFYIGNNALNHNGQYTRLPFVDPNPKYEERDFAREARHRLGRELTPSEVSRYWFRQALDWIRANPGDWAGLTWKKLRTYWGAYEVPDNLDYYLYRRSAPVLRLPIPGFGLLAPLGLLGAVLALRRPGWPRLLVLFVVTYSASVLLFFVFARFRLPMMPALFPLAGYAAVELFRRARVARAGKGGWALTRATALLVAFLVLVNLPVRGAADSLSLRIAAGLGLPLRVETSSSGHFNLGVAYAARAGEAEEPARFLDLAEAELRTALEAEGRYAETHVELGKVLARQAQLRSGPEALERNREAIDLYRRAHALEPDDPRNLHALGLLYTRLEDRPAAEDAFRQALAVEPRHVASATRLGELLLQEGRFAEAARAFEHTLRARPKDAAALSGLAAAQQGR